MAALPVVATEVVKSYGPRRALDGVSFDVGLGEVLALVGPNGAGKTTAVEMLEGYRRPDAGTVRVLGHDPAREGRGLASRIGVMLQEGGVHPGIRPLEALRLFAAFYDDPIPPEELLELVGLRDEATTVARRLSGGQRQRLALALALVGRPDVLFLDEPTAGMDPHARATTWAAVAQRRAEGAAVLLTTHAMDEAEALADRMAVIDRGRIVALGTPAELRGAGGGATTRFSARPGLDLGGLAERLGVEPGGVSEPTPGEYEVAAAPEPDLVAELAGWLRDRGVALGDLRAGRATLEEVYLRLTGERSDAERDGGA